MTGEVLALVKGAEATHCIAYCTNYHPNDKDHTPNTVPSPPLRLPSLGDLRVQDRELSKVHPGWEACATVLTNKVYFYLDPVTGQPLRHFPPGGKKSQPVPATTTFSQAITYILGPQGQLRVFAETPNGDFVVAQEESAMMIGDGGSRGQRGASSSPLLSQGRGRRLPSSSLIGRVMGMVAGSTQYDLILLMWPGAKPQRSSLIQFGSPIPNPACRERYCLTTKGWPPQNKNVRMRYARHGECPWWLGMGRICQLSLESRRHGRFEDLPWDVTRLMVLEGVSSSGNSDSSSNDSTSGGSGKERVGIEGGGRRSSPLPLLPVIQDVDDFSRGIGLVVSPVIDGGNDPWWKRVILAPIRRLNIGSKR